MRKVIFVVLLAASGLFPGVASARENNALLAGDAMTLALPLAAFGVAWFKDDREGEKEWLRNTAIDGVLTTSLRFAFNYTSLGQRPNGGGYGFPSGHASFAFCQAAFLQERYGWRYGVPALAVATAVSYIRVHEDKHHLRDVLAGGALAYGVALLTVTPYHAIQLAPIVGPDFLGLRFERSF
jgi:membrane-associated phospholipid phosphatase